MEKIRLLDQDTINKIAAGEVVERPLSVVKECIENAIDAKADAITLDIEDGGIRKIRITDNGGGMDASDVKQAFLRHATSKIHTASDLESIGTLGFRGEALASISGVSMVECMTKTQESLTGVRCVVEAGIVKEFQEIGCPNGTTFVIRELFYNVPARKKFLKTAKTEAGYITDLIYRLALSHPGISFKYMINGKTKLHTSGNFSLQDAIYQVFGKDYAKNSQYVDYAYKNYKINGFIGEPMLSRGNRQYEIYFVNGRYLKSKWIQWGIEAAYQGFLMGNQFPFCVLFITCEASLVDVNVHPTKMDARFTEEEEVKEAVRQAILATLKKKEPVVEVTLGKKTSQESKEKKLFETEKKRQLQKAPEPFESKRQVIYNQEKANYKMDNSQAVSKVSETSLGNETSQAHQLDAKLQDKELTKEVSVSDEKPSLDKRPMDEVKATKQEAIQEVLRTSSGQKFLDAQKVKHHRVIGQAFKTYWMVEYENELYIIDQHAAHEKVLYEAWVNNLSDKDIPAQQLLEPRVYELSDNEYAAYEKLENSFRQLGFDVENFGQTTIIVKSVPYLLNRPLQEVDFIHLLDQWQELSGKLKNNEPLTHQLATVACKAAIKGNDKLSVMEYQALIEQLLTLEDPYHCPHGRPTLIRLSRYEMEKQFKRIV